MMNLEFIHDVAVKVLRWDNEIAHGNAILASRGLILFRVHHMVNQRVKDPTTNQFLNIDHKTSARGSHLYYSPPSYTLQSLPSLNSDDSNRVQQMFLKKISSRAVFHPDNHKSLSKMITENLLSCFRFNMSHMTGPKNPKIVYVIVIEVWRKLLVMLVDIARLRNESDLAGTRESSSDDHQEGETGLGHKPIKLQEELGESSDIIVPEEEEEGYSETQLGDILQSLRKELLMYSKNIPGPGELFHVKAAVKMSTFNGRCRKSEEDDQCSVCLEGYREGQEIAKMPCSHIFHKRCAFEWLPTHGSCPLCRSVCTVSIYS